MSTISISLLAAAHDLHRVGLLVILFMLPFGWEASAQEVLTNKDLVQLAELGMGEEVILSKIATSLNDFDTSTDALVELKKAGMSSAVIAKVVEAGNSSSHSKVIDANEPTAPHRPGIYYIDDNGNLVELLPNVTAQSKSRGNFGTRVSYGIAKTKQVSRINGPTARTQFDRVPEFYFYFSQQETAFEQNLYNFYGFVTATSPNEFTLAKLTPKEDARELETGAANYYTSEHGISSKHAVDFDIESIAPGIYKVKPIHLAPGEYCIVYTGAAPSAYSQQKVFDFGVK